MIQDPTALQAQQEEKEAVESLFKDLQAWMELLDQEETLGTRGSQVFLGHEVHV